MTATLDSTINYEVENFFKKAGEYLTPEQVAFVRKAYDLAAEAHKDQRRKSGEPYIIHPLGVATILLGMKMDAKTLAAAFMHDVVEDTNYTKEDIMRMFGKVVAELVDGVTKLSKLEFESKEERQIESYRKMFLAMAKDVRVVLIKLADRLHNMRTMQYMPANKQERISKETFDIYVPLAGRLGMKAIKCELEDLAFRYAEPDVYYDLVEQVKMKRKEQEQMMNEAMNALKEALHNQGIQCSVQERPKNVYSIHKKMLRDNKSLNEIFDLQVVQVLVENVEDCYSALGVIHSLWHPIPGHFKDFIGVPKSYMYQALHSTVLGSMDQPLKVQILSYAMLATNEFGIVTHWSYKETGGSKAVTGSGNNFAVKLNWLHQLLEWQKEMQDAHEFVDSVKMDVLAEEVLVYSPMGDVLDLPKGSCPIDFAYRIHTAIGHSCIGAKVNGRMVPLDTILENGDIVEIVTAKQANGPSRAWLNIAGSSDTKRKIRSWFKKERREENILMGREMLEHEAERLGYDPKELLNNEKLTDVAKKLRQDTVDSLLAVLSYGGVPMGTVVVKLVDLYQKEQRAKIPKDLAAVLAELKSRKPTTNASHGILVRGEEGIMVKLAHCCNPIPGDPVVGFITRGKRVSVHRADCANAQQIKEEAKQRMIDVAWSLDIDEVYKVIIIIHSHDRPSLMSDILSITSEIKLNIFDLASHTDTNQRVTSKMGLEVSSLEQLDCIMKRMRKLKNVNSVERLMTNLSKGLGSKQ